MIHSIYPIRIYKIQHWWMGRAY